MGVANRRERFFSARRRHRAHSPAGEHLLEDASVGGIVVHHQDSQTRELWRLGVGLLLPLLSWLRGQCRGKVEPGGEVESAAAARLAFHADVSSHHFDQARGDAEAEAGAAEAPSGRAVAL